MSHLLESLMYQASQVFLFPTLVVITVLFVYAFFLLGMFAMQWWQRRQGQGGQPTRGHHLLAWAQAQPGASADELDVKAHQLLELPRIAINGGRRGFLVQIDPQVCVQLLGATPVHCALAE